MADLTGDTFAEIFPKLLQDPGDGTIEKSDGTAGATGKADKTGGNTFSGVQKFNTPSSLLNDTFDIIQLSGNATIGMGVVVSSDIPGRRGGFTCTKSRGTVGSETAVVNGDKVGFLGFKGYDGSAAQLPALVEAFVDDTVSSGSVPTKISIVTGSNSGTRAERLIVKSSGDVEVVGAFSKGSGTFLIDHPLNPEEKDLYHGFVEAPRYDLIYRGRVNLTDGKAEVDIDSTSNMSEGTFDALTKNATVTSLQNQDGFSRVKPSEIVDGKFTIECEDTVNDEISWVVIAERDDNFIRNEDPRTDENGSLIPEWEKESPNEVEFDGKKSKKVKLNKGKKGYPRHPKSHGMENIFSDEKEYQKFLEKKREELKEKKEMEKE